MTVSTPSVPTAAEESAEPPPADDGGPSGRPPEGDERASHEHETPAGVELIDATASLRPDELDELRGLAARALDELGARGETRVRLVGDDEMAREHGRSHGDPTTTDVITYDLTGGAAAAGGTLDVDLLVGVGAARREAEARGVRLTHELLLYIVHGALHCLGEDDGTPDARRSMHAREDRVLERIGVGAVYRAGGGEGR
jgi:probable rRNA maturation factor